MQINQERAIREIVLKELIKKDIHDINEEYAGSHVLGLLGFDEIMASELMDRGYDRMDRLALEIWEAIIALSTVNWENKTGISGNAGNLMNIHNMLVQKFGMEAQYD